MTAGPPAVVDSSRPIMIPGGNSTTRKPIASI